MKKLLAFLLCFSLVTSTSFSDDDSYAQKSSQLANQKQTNARGRAASGATDDSIGMSMVVWGVAFAVGIGVLATLIKSSNGTAAHATTE